MTLSTHTSAAWRAPLTFANMSEPPFQVKDPSRIHNFVMPSPRTTPVPTHTSYSLQKALFPLGGQQQHEMKGIGAGLATPFGMGMLLGAGMMVSGPQCDPESHQHQHQQASLAPMTTAAPTVVTVPGWATPGGYALCGLALCLCNLLTPGYIKECAHMMCPLWTLSLAMHIAWGSQQQQNYGACWVWSGVLTLLLLPFVIMVGSPLFVGFFLLVFALFSSFMFWRRLQGATFILAWLCWAGLVVTSGLSVGVIVPPQMHLCVASFFSISLGVINSGGGKYIIRLG
jgi:hypothetical protein